MTIAVLVTPCLTVVNLDNPSRMFILASTYYGPNRSTVIIPQTCLDRFALLCTVYTCLFSLNGLSSSNQTKLFWSSSVCPSTYSPNNNFITKGFSICNVCLFYTSIIKVFFYCKNLFHYLSGFHSTQEIF